MHPNQTMNNVCTFSSDRIYRYSLEHACRSEYEEYPPHKKILFIGLNPSTADEACLDPTLRRLRRFTLDWGFDTFIMMNLFAFRATDPRDMKKAKNPVGMDNDYIFLINMGRADLCVACWGNHGTYLGRDAEVRGLFKDYDKDLYCFSTTKKGQPSHPLYLPGNMTPVKLS